MSYKGDVRGLADLPSEYVTSLPFNVFKAKTYFENSSFARIITYEGVYFVHNVCTGVYYPAKNYMDAKGLRAMVSQRYSTLEKLWN